MAGNETLMNQVREKFRARGTTTSLKSIGRCFKIFDDDGDRKLTKEEFTEGLKDYGCTFSREEINQLFIHFDKDNSGRISYDEFIFSVQPPMNESRRKIVDQAFEKFDKSGDGFITFKDLNKVYKFTENPQYLSGAKTEEELGATFIGNYKPFYSTDKLNGKLTKQEFIDYYQTISIDYVSDAAFELMIRMSWKI